MKLSLERDQYFDMATKLTAGKRQSYTVSDKLRIIQFAEQNGNRAAEREFGVSESNVRLWRKSKENLEKMPRLKRANRGKKAAWPELEVDLLSWITEKRNNGLAILPSLVRLKALELAKDEKYGIPEGHFKAGNHWCQRFMKRNGLSLRQKTTLGRRRSLLVFDSFEVHVTDTVKASFKRENTQTCCYSGWINFTSPAA